MVDGKYTESALCGDPMQFTHNGNIHKHSAGIYMHMHKTTKSRSLKYFDV